MGVVSVLDVTSEWPATSGWGDTIYKTIPVLDTLAPSYPQLIEGANWLLETTQRGPVYVHCALGHGRSATFVVAYLLVSKHAQSLDEAIALLKAQRPAVTLSTPQVKVLRALNDNLQKDSF